MTTKEALEQFVAKLDVQERMTDVIQLIWNKKSDKVNPILRSILRDAIELGRSIGPPELSNNEAVDTLCQMAADIILGKDKTT